MPRTAWNLLRGRLQHRPLPVAVTAGTSTATSADLRPRTSTEQRGACCATAGGFANATFAVGPAHRRRPGRLDHDTGSTSPPNSGSDDISVLRGRGTASSRGECRRQLARRGIAPPTSTATAGPTATTSCSATTPGPDQRQSGPPPRRPSGQRRDDAGTPARPATFTCPPYAPDTDVTVITPRPTRPPRPAATTAADTGVTIPAGHQLAGHGRGHRRPPNERPGLRPQPSNPVNARPAA